MSVLRYRSEGATVTLNSTLQGVAERVRRRLGPLLRPMEAAAETVRAYAAAEWYQRVDRETGKSGQLTTVTTIDADRGLVRVSVGSTDDRKDKRGRPAVAFIRAPGRDSLVLKEVSRREFFAAPEMLRFRYPFIKVHNPKAATGSKLIDALIRTPLKKQIRTISPQLRAALGEVLGG